MVGGREGLASRVDGQMGQWIKGGGAAACFGKVESVLRPDLFVGMQRAAREGRVREIQGGRLRAVQGREGSKVRVCSLLASVARMML